MPVNYGFGYGIGRRGPLIHLLLWVIVVSAFGAILLRQSVDTNFRQDKGIPWFFCASLARLLSASKISKNIEEFFDESHQVNARVLRPRLFRTVAIGLASVGWVLVMFLVAALAGLTEGS
jgi:hypothetical protein